MFDDEPDDEQDGPGPPIHPDDRLWRHPSEMGESRATSVTHRTTSKSFWSVAVVAGLAGATVAVTALAVTGSLSPRVIERRASLAGLRSTTVSSATVPKSVRALAAEAAAVVVMVEAGTGTSRRSGSGVALRADGILLTSAALVRGTNAVTVTLADGRTIEGSVVGSDSASGIGVLRVPADGLAAARTTKVGLHPGDTAVTVGRPAAGGPTSVTAGVVSSLEGKTDRADGMLWGMIETDRPVPALADGGALVGPDGSVTGICLAAQGKDPEPAPSAMGYAVPIAVAAGVANDLVVYGRVRKAWLGVEGADLTDASAKALGVEGGAHLSRVEAGGPAAKGGLLAGDVVTAVASAPIRSMLDLQGALALQRPGQKVGVTVLRAKSATHLTVALIEKGA
ncbi:MAG: trypsin-like peptidase domain-containing protein [Acidimicrobiales bacterium]